MDTAYWLAAGVLALFYLYSGGLKLLRSREQLAPMMAWAGTTVPMAGVRAIGTLEVLGGLGLALPPLSGILPVLAVVAALGLVVLQILATGFHLTRGETRDLWLNLGLAVLAGTVAWLATGL